MKDIRLIVMDLDGTLMQKDGTILPSTREALLEAQREGIVTAIASGRYPENASLVFLDNGLKGPVIGSNGTYVTDGVMGKCLFLHTMKDETALGTREVLESFHANYLIFSHKLVATSAKTLVHHSEVSDGPRIKQLGKVEFHHGPHAVEQAIGRGVCKYYVFRRDDLNEIAARLRQVPGLDVTRSNPYNLELMPRGVDKGSGVRELAGWLGIPLKNVMAFGDEENDLPMLTTVGCGIAMGNALPEIKKVCRYVTAPFDEDGVGRAIREYAL